MSKPPPIPKDQRAGPNDRPDITGVGDDRRDDAGNLQSDQPGNDDVNLRQQGRHGDINQNTHHQGYQQNR